MASQRGVTLIELIVFITVVALAMGALLSVYQHSVVNSVDPVVRVRLLEAAQSQLDEVLAQPYDANTPAGGVPACGSTVPAARPPAPVCADAGGVSSFDGYSDSPYVGYQRQVNVELAGTELGLPNNAWAKRITVVATAPDGQSLTLSAYRTNF
ncbi:prepilin-type N-terminal cleavage/methylation domain-containing protein [Marinimicrobium locisalis]|uniref:prepilin-type N-terminal cleavage/methylation domain-containing protein n=1 Tax=Marinimicrobium locisalis TaxID=546022 RepID=UPI003221E862